MKLVRVGCKIAAKSLKHFRKCLGKSKPLQIHTMGVGKHGQVETGVQAFAAMVLVVQGTIYIEMLGKRGGSTLLILDSITRQERLQSCDVVWVASHDTVKQQLGASIVVFGVANARLFRSSKEFQQMMVDTGIAQRFSCCVFQRRRKARR
jgi:hypothetical protein